MAREKDDGKDAVDALKGLLARIGDIFGVFDLSFFVAGSVGFGALLFCGYVFGYVRYENLPLSPNDWSAIHVVTVVLVSYVIGIVCFSLGRLFAAKDFYGRLYQTLEDFGIDSIYGPLFGAPVPGAADLADKQRSEAIWLVRYVDDGVKKAEMEFKRATEAKEKAAPEDARSAAEACENARTRFTRARGLRDTVVEAKKLLEARYTPDHSAKRGMVVYTRLWAEVRQSKQLAPSLNLLVRYWILAAMCDGLAAAFFLWFVAWIVWGFVRRDQNPSPPAMWVTVLVTVVLVGVIVLCIRESRRYREYQMYELVATLAHKHDRLGQLGASPPMSPEDVERLIDALQAQALLDLTRKVDVAAKRSG